MKNKRFELRLDEELKLFIHEAAKELDCSESAFVRDRIFSPEYFKITIDYDKELDKGINKVGNNMNQIARNLNTLMNVFKGNEDQLIKEDGILVSLRKIEELLLENKKVFENILKEKHEANKNLFNVVMSRETYEFLHYNKEEEEEWHM